MILKKGIYYILQLVLVFILPLYSYGQYKDIECDYIITNSMVSITNYEATPGDTMCLEAGYRPYLYLKNIKGSEAMPVVIINYQGQSIIESELSYGIKFAACEHIVISGSGVDSIDYGISIKNVDQGNGINIGGKSTNFEVESIEISHTKYVGIVAKTDPDCTFSAVRDSFTMYYINIHDNYLHNIGTEGMYIGNSFFLGHTIVACDTVVLPHIIEGVKVYNNRLEYLGWDGIQVGCALYDCDIYDNYIYKDSQEEKLYQMSGIMINTGSSCHAYNNEIRDGQGTGGQLFYNNLIVNAGRFFDFQNQVSNQQFGIFCKHKYIDPPDSTFSFFNNTIINPKSDGIRFMNLNSINNKFANNIIINPGAYVFYDTNGALINEGKDAYIHNYRHESDLNIYNNILERSASGQFFVDTLVYDYHLSFKSPAVNSGVNLLDQNIFFDLENNIRPYDVLFDIGAYELQSASGLYDINNKTITFDVFPNPVVSVAVLSVDMPKEVFLSITASNNNGETILLLTDKFFNRGENIISLNLGKLTSGMWILTLRGEGFILNKKIIKIN